MVSSARLLEVALFILRVAYAAAEYTGAQECGGTYTASVFSVVTPSYPASLPCEVVVQPASPSVCGLELDLGNLSLPCPSDLLFVDGEAICGVPPGAVVQAPFRHPRTIITFRGSPEGGEGVNISVQQIDCSRNQPDGWCGGEVSGEATQIVSSGYPLKYPGDLNCRYTIKASDPTVCQVEVTFSNSSLDGSSNCSKDSLQISNDKLCGTLEGTKTYDIDESLTIAFKTGPEGGEKGFNLTAKQIRCVDVGPTLISAVNGHLASEKSDCDHESRQGISIEGYTVQPAPFPPFSDVQRQHSPFVGYLPPFNVENKQRIPLEQPPPRFPPVRQYFPTNPSYPPYQPDLQVVRPLNIVPFQSYGPPTVYRTPYHQPQYLPPYRHSFPPYTPSTPRPFSYWPIQPDVRQSTNQQCCNQVYTDSHFLLVSPGFPRSTTTDCVYTISKFSSLTYQIRYQFRYFWTGEDTGTGCSGGYLEIDGTKVCGCKTGTSWTSQFLDTETYKTLHLKLDTTFNRLFNGFVLEVYQDDSYSQRYVRASDGADILNNTELPRGTVSNFSQFVETLVEREPLLDTYNDNQVIDRTASQPVWDSSRQAWSLPTDWLCVRWNLQDWLILAREVLWAKYQCPASSSSSSSTFRSDATQTDSCRTCLYLCRANCQCC